MNLRGTHIGESPDEELDRVEQFFQDLPNFELRAGQAIRRAFDEVIDGPRTGRWDIEQLEKTEKTYIGTKVEILLRAEFDLPRGEILDCNVSGVEVDIKFTIGANWTIPGEAIEHVCLLVRASDKQSRFSAGLLRTSLANLNLGRNRDGKTTINASGRQAVRWLVEDGSLPENVLFHFDPAVRDQIFGFCREWAAKSR